MTPTLAPARPMPRLAAPGRAGSPSMGTGAARGACAGRESALRVVPEEAALVREARRRVAAGESLRSIARDLNERGRTTTRGRPWSGSTLRKVLLRPITAGLRASGGETVGKGQWEPLPEEAWRGVQVRPGRRTTERYARRYRGSGLCLCGVCGAPLTGNTTAGGGLGERQAAYRCRTADRDGVSLSYVGWRYSTTSFEESSSSDCLDPTLAGPPPVRTVHVLLDAVDGLLRR